MARPPRLSDEEVASQLAELPGWTLRAGKLHRELDCGTFVEAFALMSRMALVSERMNHHPEWSNVYGKLVIDLSTHDAGGLTALDFAWARELESSGYGGPSR